MLFSHSGTIPFEPPVRIELTTAGLQNRSSTAELRWQINFQKASTRAQLQLVAINYTSWNKTLNSSS